MGKPGPKTPEGKAKAIANLRGGLKQPSGGRTAEYIRAILREGLEVAAPKIVKIMNFEAPVPGLPKPGYKDAAKSWEIGAKYSMPELEKVVEERFIFAVAEALRDDPRIELEWIEDITAAITAKLGA